MITTQSDANTNGTAAQAIAFDDLRSTYRISVQTQRSNYQFSVLDPCSRTGLLTGGLLGNRKLKAVLTGTISTDSTAFDSTELKTGVRALFLVGSKDHVRRLITSVITEIAIDKDCGASEKAAA
jgi:hypothetical protein